MKPRSCRASSLSSSESLLTPLGASSVGISTICCRLLPVALPVNPYLGAEATVSVEADGDAVGGVGFISTGGSWGLGVPSEGGVVGVTCGGGLFGTGVSSVGIP